MTPALDMIRGRSNIVTLTNKSGGPLVAGDVCVIDTANDEAATTTTSAASTLKVYIAAESIASNATGKFYSSGFCPLVTPSASTTRGRYLFTHTVAKQAAENATYGAGAFGVILKSGTTPSVWLFGSTAQGTGGSFTGTTGSTDNAILRADGTGGATIQSSLATVDDSGTVNIPTAQTYNINGSPHTHAAASSLLAVNNYSPGSFVGYTAGSASQTDVDATNMKVTFTAPASGNVLVRLSALCDMGSGGYGCWGLRESTTNIASGIILNQATQDFYCAAVFYVTGISAGSHTYKWSFSRSGGTFTININGAGNVQPAAVMEVWAAP